MGFTVKEMTFVLKRFFMEKNPKKVRVVLVSDSMQPWNFGGKEERLRHLQDSYLKQPESEFEVLYATMKWWDENPPANHLAISKLRPMYHKERRSIRQAVFFALACLKIIRLRPDVIEADQIPILQLYVIKFVAKVTRSSFSVTWHEVWSEADWKEYLGRFGWLASKLETHALKLPDNFIAVSVPTRFKLVHAGVAEDKIDLIEPDIDRPAITRATTKLPAADLLFAGRMIANKNLDLVIKAMALLASASVYVTAAFVGDGPELLKLINLAKELGVRSQITFHGFLSHNEDVWGLMKKCGLFISPSTREGYGFSVMEAHFAGAKIIIAEHPNNASTYYLEGLKDVTLVKESSAEAYAEVIKDLLPSVRSVNEAPEIEIFSIYQKYEKSWGKMIQGRGDAS
jgi:glycosyltransferase involved in cell wall biosynthesis